MDNFFHNLNKKMADLAQRQDLAESAVTERDQGKHNNATTGFKALAKKAGKEYGSKAAGERVAGAQFQKMKRAGKLEEGQCSSCDCSPCECDSMGESAFQAAIGKKKYGDAGMKALQKAGRNHASNTTMNNIRNRYDKYDEADNMSLEEADMEENNEFGGARQAAIKAGRPTFTVNNKTYRVSGDTSDEKQMEEGAFKELDIDRQEQEMKKSRHNPGNSPLRQVPGVQNLKPKSKEHPLKNVARGLRAFVKGEPEPMDEVKKAKPDYPDIDHDGNRKESMKKAAADKTRSTGTAFDPEARKKSKTDQEGTGNFDKKKVSTGTVYTRRHKEDEEGEVTSNEPKRKGRPKGPVKGPERVTAKSYKYKQGRPVKENEISIMNRGEYDQEGDEVKGDMHTVIRHAQELEKHLRDGENLPTWVIEKVGQIKGMMTSISDYMMSQHERGAEQATGQEGIRIAEKAVSVKQRRAAGIAHAAQKGEIPKSKLRGASKAMAKMPEKELDKFASTKEKGLPKKVKETTTAGSVATGGEAPKSTKGMSFGKGVYEGAVNESYERKLHAVLNEGMNVTVNMNGQGQKSVNVSADGEDAEKLAEILKLAGLGNSDTGGCSSCGQSPCGCETVDEAYGDTTATKNSPDWPTDTETTDDNDPYLRRLSGGLNGAKSTGQTTVPVVASQLRRQVSMEENVKLERSLFDTWKTYKGQ